MFWIIILDIVFFLLLGLGLLRIFELVVVMFSVIYEMVKRVNSWCFFGYVCCCCCFFIFGSCFLILSRVIIKMRLVLLWLYGRLLIVRELNWMWIFCCGFILLDYLEFILCGGFILVYDLLVMMFIRWDMILINWGEF